MLTYVVRRVLLMFPTLLGVTVLVFFVMGLAPGGIGGPMLDAGDSPTADAEKARDYINKRYGLNSPLVVQYGRWLNDLLPVGYVRNDDFSMGRFSFWKSPTLGTSLAQRRPVSEMITESLPITLLLNVITIPVVYLVAIFTGVRAARDRGGLFDKTTGGLQLGLWSVPSIWAGVMLIGMLANKQYVHWFPTSGLHETDAANMSFLPHFTPTGWARGWMLDTAWHLVLPVVCLSYASTAFLTKLTRGSILQNLGEDYVRTARAKGLPANVVLYRHVFRNSTLALITVAAGILPALLGGSVVVERIFSIPGMGQLSVEAVANRDREVVLAVTLIGGAVGLVSQLLRDILYAVADPRVSYG